MGLKVNLAECVNQLVQRGYMDVTTFFAPSFSFVSSYAIVLLVMLLSTVVPVHLAQRSVQHVVPGSE